MVIQRPKTIVEQVTEVLRLRIHERTYPPGGRLPSEKELAQELGVSRTTVRTVLAKFATEGLIFRKQGDGTYVNEYVDEVETHYGGIWDFSRLIEANGYRPSIKTVSLTSRAATPEEERKLRISAESPVIAMVRVFYANQRPVIYASNVFPDTLIKVNVAQLVGNLPLHQFMQTYCHEQITYVVSDIEAIIVQETQLQTLNAPVGTPLLKLRDMFYNKENIPLILGMSHYDFTVLRLRRVQTWGQ